METAWNMTRVLSTFTDTGVCEWCIPTVQSGGGSWQVGDLKMQISGTFFDRQKNIKNTCLRHFFFLNLTSSTDIL